METDDRSGGYHYSDCCGPVRAVAPSWNQPRGRTQSRASDCVSRLRSAPSFSPDGTQIAFAWDNKERGSYDIYVKLIGAGDPIRLTSDPAPEYNPVWSPDGRWIAFVRDVSDVLHSLLVMPALGGSEQKLTYISFDKGGTQAWETWMGVSTVLAWSPDSRWITYVDTPAPGDAVALSAISVDSGEKRRLTRPTRPNRGDMFPSFSPDGKWISFTRLLSVLTGDIS
jgi:Tol biopolymer transport system component